MKTVMIHACTFYTLIFWTWTYMAYFWRSFLLPPSSWFGLEMSQEMDASQQLWNKHKLQYVVFT